MSESELLARLGTSAEKWAEAFVDRALLLPVEEVFDDSPGGFVFGWFANAIGADESAVYSAQYKEKPVIVSESSGDQAYWDEVRDKTIRAQRSKVETYEALKEENLPIPIELKQEVERWKLENSYEA